MGTTISVPQRDVAPGGSKVVSAGGKQIALFNVGGTFYAMENACAHRGGPLGEGSLDGTTVTCPWHAWEYDVATGVCQMNDKIKLATYPVRTEHDQVIIEVP